MPLLVFVLALSSLSFFTSTKKDNMKIDFCQIEKKEIWENFLLGIEEKTFLNSWDWGEFQKVMGNKIWRFGIFENNNLISIALIIKIQAKRGTFLFLPHGPSLLQSNKIFNFQFAHCSHTAIFKKKILKTLLEELKKIAEKENCSFIRIAPLWKKSEENIRIFRDLGFREAPIHIHPELTWQLDITIPENQLLKNMRKTTRYLIRQAQKNKNIEILKSKNPKDIEIFNKLYQETVFRHHFIPFSLEYLRNEFSALSPDNQISIFIGKYKKEVQSSAMIIFWQDIAFYHQGASSLKYPKIPVSYLLQWQAIKEAKKRGCKLYNFWGITESKSKKHPWFGLTLFKKGFGGYKKEYIKTEDFILSSKYWLNYIVERMRKIKRNL